MRQATMLPLAQNGNCVNPAGSLLLVRASPQDQNTLRSHAASRHLQNPNAQPFNTQHTPWKPQDPCSGVVSKAAKGSPSNMPIIH